MNETTHSTPTETPETVETQTPAPEDTDTLTQLRSELREAGEAGKKQWQEAFTRTREALTTTRSEVERVALRTRDVATATYARAEARGADLLLRLVSQVRATAEAVEASLRTRAAASEVEVEGAHTAQPVTA